MKISDIFEMAQKNFRRLFRKNIGLIIIFAMVIIVFNITYTLTSAMTENTSSNITDNQNLKIINVSTVGECITEEEAEYISKLDHVEMTVYNYCLSVAIEDNSGTEVAAIGIDDVQADYLSGENVSLGDSDIILNTSFKESGYNIGDTIDISYNVRLSDSGGVRESRTYTIAAFYEQPVIETWFENVALVSAENVFTMASSLYGVDMDTFKSGNLYKQSLLVFVDDVDNVAAVAELIEGKSLITSYALAYSQELPAFGKAIVAVGGAIIGILLIMGVVVMNATLNKNIEGRYKEIGILKSVGMKESHIFGILCTEVLLLWLVISTVAVIISMVAIKLLPNINIMSVLGDVGITFGQIFLSVTVSYLIMFLTTVMTIRRASKLKTIEVLRNA